jgi:hypothetical protein
MAAAEFLDVPASMSIIAGGRKGYREVTVKFPVVLTVTAAKLP